MPLDPRCPRRPLVQSPPIFLWEVFVLVSTHLSQALRRRGGVDAEEERIGGSGDECSEERETPRRPAEEHNKEDAAHGEEDRGPVLLVDEGDERRRRWVHPAEVVQPLLVAPDGILLLVRIQPAPVLDLDVGGGTVVDRCPNLAQKHVALRVDISASRDVGHIHVVSHLAVAFDVAHVHRKHRDFHVKVARGCVVDVRRIPRHHAVRWHQIMPCPNLRDELPPHQVDPQDDENGRVHQTAHNRVSSRAEDREEEEAQRD
mmetsp:Transcript_21541/g.49817  ORF Transcript_21541/g.49817 Transcript_21541/m.49817 type:complete len:259 (-) Transcript_21541:175-951(-)